MANELYISKIKLLDGVEYLLKDEEARELISSLTDSKLNYVVVETRPEVGQKNTIYLVKDTTATGDNTYVEWLFVQEGEFGGTWERLGTTDKDFSEYLKKVDKIPLYGNTDNSDTEFVTDITKQEDTKEQIVSSGKVTAAGSVGESEVTDFVTTDEDFVTGLNDDGVLPSVKMSAFHPGSQGELNYVDPVLEIAVDPNTSTLSFNWIAGSASITGAVAPSIDADLVNGGSFPTVSSGKALTAVTGATAAGGEFIGEEVDIAVTANKEVVTASGEIDKTLATHKHSNNGYAQYTTE